MELNRAWLSSVARWITGTAAFVAIALVPAGVALRTFTPIGMRAWEAAWNVPVLVAAIGWAVALTAGLRSPIDRMFPPGRITYALSFGFALALLPALIWARHALPGALESLDRGPPTGADVLDAQERFSRAWLAGLELVWTGGIIVGLLIVRLYRVLPPPHLAVRIGLVGIALLVAPTALDLHRWHVPDHPEDTIPWVLALPALVAFVVAARRPELRVHSLLGVAACCLSFALLFSWHVAHARHADPYWSKSLHFDYGPLQRYSGRIAHRATLAADACSLAAGLSLVAAVVVAIRKSRFERDERLAAITIGVWLVVSQLQAAHSAPSARRSAPRLASVSLPMLDDRAMRYSPLVPRVSRRGTIEPEVVFSSRAPHGVTWRDEDAFRLLRATSADRRPLAEAARLLGRTEDEVRHWNPQVTCRRATLSHGDAEVPPLLVAAPPDLPLSRLRALYAEFPDVDCWPDLRLLVRIDVHRDQPGIPMPGSRRTEIGAFEIRWVDDMEQLTEPTAQPCGLHLAPGGVARRLSYPRARCSPSACGAVADPEVTIGEFVTALEPYGRSVALCLRSESVPPTRDAEPGPRPSSVASGDESARRVRQDDYWLWEP